MKRIIYVAAALVALVALAGENTFLGQLSVTGGSSQSNTNNFWIPFHSKLTVFCDADARFLADSATVSRDGGTNRGVPVAANTLFPTSVDGPTWTTDAGLPSATVAVTSALDDGGVNCELWRRSGTE